MSIEQLFLQWYVQLFPEDQNVLCSFLLSWINQQLPPNLNLPYLPLIVQNFLQAYQQLPPSDQQALVYFLRNWLNPPPPPRRTVPTLSFGGIPSGPVSAKTQTLDKSNKSKCPNCGYEF